MSWMADAVEWIRVNMQARRLNVDPEFYAESRGCRDVERHGQVAPGSGWDETAQQVDPAEHARMWPDWPPPPGQPRCGGCAILATTPKALRFHRTRDGRCLNPATDTLQRGNPPMNLVGFVLDGRPVWGWPQAPRPSRAATLAALAAGPEAWAATHDVPPRPA